MITATSTKEEILTAIDKAVSDMGGLISSLDENQVNTVPYEGSWTAGQLVNHVTKSISGLAGAMLKEAPEAERNPAEKVAGFQKTFLDFSTKMQSPDFIIPGAGPWQKQQTIEALKQSFELLKENAGRADLNQLLTGLPMGDATKLELLHFVLYHTQRHLHQMKKITGALLSK